jgi:hypothetical protein
MRLRGSMMGAAATIEEIDRTVTIDANFILAGRRSTFCQPEIVQHLLGDDNHPLIDLDLYRYRYLYVG